MTTGTEGLGTGLMLQPLKLWQIGLLCSVLIWVMGCASSDSPSDQPSNTLTISEESFEGTWPFTVDSGELRCERSSGHGLTADAVFFTANGKEYGINGFGLEQAPRPTPIWRKASGPAPRVSLGDVMDRGLKLCSDE